MNKKRLAVWFDLSVDFSWSGGKVEKCIEKYQKIKYGICYIFLITLHINK
jgi:hypothetical protein